MLVGDRHSIHVVLGACPADPHEKPRGEAIRHAIKGPSSRRPFAGARNPTRATAQPKTASAQTPESCAPHCDPPAPPHAHRGMSAATPRRLAQRLGWTKASDGKGGDWEACGGAAKFNLEKLVGRGSYGQVCAATQISDGKPVAVKRVVGAFDSRRDALCIIREVRILAALPRHDNIVNLLDVRTPLDDPSDDADVFLIFEKAATDLEKVVASNQYFTGDHIRWLSLDLLRGLRWLHSAGVVHRDLKPANCLLEVKPVSLKICDFGPWLSVVNALELDLVAAMASSRRLDAVDVAVRESTRLVNVWGQFRDAVVPRRARQDAAAAAPPALRLATGGGRRRHGFAESFTCEASSQKTDDDARRHEMVSGTGTPAEGAYLRLFGRSVGLRMRLGRTAVDGEGVGQVLLGPTAFVSRRCF